MEKDCILAQGAPGFARDRLMEQSDETRVWFCKLCGLPAQKSMGGVASKHECRLCGTNQVAEVRMPYATKLAMQEFMSVNVIIRVLTSPFGDTVLTAGNKNLGPVKFI